jgi:hypothetical protein
MSMSEAQVWIRAAVANPESRRSATLKLNAAADAGVETTILFGPHLMKKRRCQLAWWDGHQLLRRELSPAEQTGFRVKPDSLLHYRTDEHRRCDLPPLPRFAMADVRFDNAKAYNGIEPMTGSVRMTALPHPGHVDLRFLTLFAHMQHPNVDAFIRQSFSLRTAVWGPDTPLQFSFGPLFDNDVPPVDGPLLVWLYIAASETLAGPPSDCQRISNVAVGTVDVHH